MSRQLPDLPNVDASLFESPKADHFKRVGTSTHAPKILLLYGSLRERSYSKLLTFEAQRLLEAMGAETRIFNPEGLPLPDGHPESHAKVQELRALAAWSEGMVWTSPERHGAMTGIMKAQIDWIPLSIGSVRPIQGKTLAVMEVSGGSRGRQSSARNSPPASGTLPCRSWCSCGRATTQAPAASDRSTARAVRANLRAKT